MSIIVETGRLALREFEAGDAEDLFRIHSDPETMRFQNSGPDSLEHERETLVRHARTYYDVHGFGIWTVERREDKRLLGTCGLIFQEVDGENHIEISYLIDRDHWNQGYATEAVRGVLEIARPKFGIDKLIAIIAPANAASIRVAEKCDFGLEKQVDSYKKFSPVFIYSKNLAG